MPIPMTLAPKAIGAGLLVDIGGSVLTGTLLGLLVSTGEHEGLLRSPVVADMPAAVVASVFAGICFAVLGGYTVYTGAYTSRMANVCILGAIMTLCSFVGAVIDFHMMDPGRISDYITSASVPFVFPLTLLGGYLAKWRAERIQAPVLAV